MKRRISPRLRFRQDWVAHGDYIAADNPAVACRFIDAVDATLAFLASLPGIGHPWDTDQPRYQKLRWYPVRGFPRQLIFYRDTSDKLDVIRLCHSSQDLEALFR